MFAAFLSSGQAMNLNPVTPAQETVPDPHRAPRRRWIFVVGGGILASLMLVLLALFWIYAGDTQHANRNSIWWSERGRGLIPPAATGITLRQGLLDHYATYSISDLELSEFLKQRFADGGHPPFEKRSAAPEEIGRKVGYLDWVMTKDTVVYNCVASNGGTHLYYHDLKTGQTYQDSAYW